MYKKWNFPGSITSVNVTESTGNCGFGKTYWRSPSWKTCKMKMNIFYAEDVYTPVHYTCFVH